MSDETTPQDSAAMSPASAGSHGSLVAWAVFAADGHCVGTYATQEHARIVTEELACDGMVHEPLYRSPALTDEEREALARVADDASYRAMGRTERVVRGLLERTK